MNIKYINDRISKEICYNTIHKLKDNSLSDIYKKTNSYNLKCNKLTSILNRYIKNERIKKNIVNDMTNELISVGLKSKVRGNEFNYIIKEKIKSLNLDNKQYKIFYEKHFNQNLIHEKPDWYIEDNINNKVLIGMNQIDIWSGGHQLNRGFNYIYNYDSILSYNQNIKLLCVVCNEIKLKSNKNKIYQLFNKGFTDNTLCYLNNLDNIIYDYFNIEK